MLRLARQPVSILERIGVDLEIPLARLEQPADQLAAGDMWRQLNEFLDVLVETLASSVGNGLGDVGDRTGHVGQRSRVSVRASFFLEFG